jgi:hypothetical protein
MFKASAYDPLAVALMGFGILVLVAVAIVF